MVKKKTARKSPEAVTKTNPPISDPAETRRTKQTHRCWHSFMSKFMHKDVYDPRTKWKLRGNDLIYGIEAWAVKWPNDVHLVWMDDSYFASSLLCLIEHKNKDEFMGTSMVFVAQCSGDPPVDFFMYPDHQRQLTEALCLVTAHRLMTKDKGCDDQD